MSDNISVVEVERIREFEKRVRGYQTTLADSQRKLHAIVDRVSSLWRDPDFMRMMQTIEITDIELNAAQKVVDDQLLPFITAKRKLLDEKQEGR